MFATSHFDFERFRSHARRSSSHPAASWRVAAALIGVMTTLSWGVATSGQDEPVPHNQDRPPNPARDPETARAAMTVPDGFHVELVAAEPDLVNPVAMTIDEKGRFWITESLEYPRRSAGPGRDRLKVLEDTNGDGKADKVTVFADGLNIPSGVAVGGGGVWLANAPDLLFLKDTNGDGQADHREVVLTGFGRDDTHELPNSLTWGPDGWLYGLNGVFNPSTIAYRGRIHKFTCALFRIHPVTREFEVFAEGTSNPWGVAFNHEGDAFLSACVIDHLWHLVETGYYHRQGGPYPPHTWKAESIVDYGHQKAAYCGIHFFDSDAYPPAYRGKLYMGNIHGGCINVDEVNPVGATYKGTKHPDFLTANDAWFMPVVQKTGPDGCLYVLDWYDRYHCYQDANRDPEGIDRLRGRLYRIRYGDTPRVVGLNLAAETDAQLLERLGASNDYLRDQARRLLWERGTPAIAQRLQQMILDDSLPRVTRLNALFTRVAIGNLPVEDHLTLLSHPDPTVRAWAVRAVGNAPAGPPARREAVAVRDEAGRTPVPSRQVDRRVWHRIVELALDPDPKVALQVAVAARKMPDGIIDPVELLATLARHPSQDDLLARVVWQNLHPLLPGDPEGGDDAPATTRKPDGSRGATVFLNALANAPADQPAPNLEPMLARLAGIVEPADAARLLDLTQQRFAQRLDEVLSVLVARVGDGGSSPRAAWIEALGSKIGRLARRDTAPFAARQLAALLGDNASRTALLNLLAGDQVDPGQRLAVLETLLRAIPPDSDEAQRIALTVIDRLGDDATPLEDRARWLSALGRCESPALAAPLLESFDRLPAPLQPRVVELLTQRASWSEALLEAIAQGALDRSAVNLTQARKLQASGHPKVAKRAVELLGKVREGRNPEREQVVARMRELLFRTPGDPQRGKLVFAKVCAQCHVLHGEGYDVGPELTNNGRNSYDQLISNTFDPSLVIGQAYQAVLVVVDDGRVLSGLKVEDGPERVVLKLQGGQLETLPRAAIEEIHVSESSLMPEKLEEQLTTQEIADLFEYLSWDKPPGAPGARRLPDAPNFNAR
ncbi:membrane-bound dehydrogenase domain protein [Isosphaera pallida ATCC 43644]|uniref:Membrane-bound dehydrogenase domain protein n=1 Tax=Isosphaera pallida (strain ATCC 43644 / DSM 9630 / IS1B) TaxID=575540 RepID=E8QYQ1_ISOPI|nr:PVC-type heme-binding CxxCH protein [Isosphaera pallida]ADV61027.1 membrane-bound dehydrogenase domain protein [Isosphaera pallida ATCC 43644]